jgi:hypothetical protein
MGQGVSRRSEIVITPSPRQYRQLCRDLEALRIAGAESNTDAVLAAVHEAVVNANLPTTKKMAERRGSAPGPAQED